MSESDDRTDGVLAEDLDAVADTLETLGATDAVATCRAAASRLWDMS